jgi:hypothetical protein
VALLNPLHHVRGYAAPETKAAVERARTLIEQAEALGEPPDDPLLLFSVLYGFWGASYMAFNGDVNRSLAMQFLALAEKQGTTASLLIAHRVMGISLLAYGAIAECRPHLDRAITLYDPAEHRPLTTRFAVDAKVSTLGFRAMALWLLGYPNAALADADQGVSGAREIGQAASLMQALSQASRTRIFCGNYAEASAEANEQVALADEKGALLWKAFALKNQRGILVLSGKPADAVQMIASEIATWRSIGATVLLPLDLSYSAQAYAALGKLDDAWR